MAGRKVTWKSGDVFAVPLPGTQWGVGQVVSEEPDCLDSALCCYYSHLTKGVDELKNFAPSRDAIVSVQLTTRDLLDRGSWPIVLTCQPPPVEDLFPIVELRRVGYVGAKVRGSKIMSDFLAAFHGLAPWNAYKDPHYFDALLVPGARAPARAVMPRADARRTGNTES
jgi:immunity protein 26 of polymorphic toxin system